MRKITLCIVILTLLASCNKEFKATLINEGPVVINGVISDYDSTINIGRLTYFDAVTRIAQSKVITIDSTGNFSLEFNLTHPIFGSIFFELGDSFYDDFFIEPNKIYNVTVNENEFVFHGESGQLNRELTNFYDSLSSNLISEDEYYNRIKINNGKPKEIYDSIIDDLKSKKIDYLNYFTERYRLEDKTKSLIENDIIFQAAHSRLMFMYDDNHNIKDSLPNDFYTQIFNDYPILNLDELYSRNCNDYLSNIVTILSRTDDKVDSRMEYIKSANYFSPSELQLIARLYNSDPDVRKTPEYKNFYSQSKNIAMLSDLFYRYNFQALIKNLDLLQSSISKDLVVSQAFARNFIEKSISPGDNEMRIINKEIKDKSILNYLSNRALQDKQSLERDKTDMPLESKLEDVLRKYIHKYQGKVIYIDFYATWCGPCIQEIPFSKELQYKFRNRDVVFLNLCAKSKEENWKTMIKDRNIEGENYLLNDSEYIILSELFNVNGFPTYAIVGRDGKIIEKNAPRPSSQDNIEEKIRKYLEP